MSIFTKEHYNSGDGMLTAVWGPPLWHSLHTISFNYPVKPTKEDKDNYYNYFKSIQFVLPCRYCRENFSKFLNYGTKVKAQSQVISGENIGYIEGYMEDGLNRFQGFSKTVPDIQRY